MSNLSTSSFSFWSFTWRVLSFSAPLLVLFVTLEVLTRRTPDEYSIKMKRFKESLPEIEVLILGSSHALRGFNPHIFKEKNAFNMAMVAQHVTIDHDILLRYGESMPKLKYIILSISQFSLGQRISYGEIANRLPFYKYYYDMDYSELGGNEVDFYCIQSALGSRKSLERVIGYYITNSIEFKCDSLGWMGAGGNQMRSEEDWIQDATDVASRHNEHNFDFNENVELLVESVNWAKRKGVSVIFVNTPKSVYYNSLTDMKISERIDSTMNNIVREHDNAKYLDLKSDKLFDLTCFRNSDHVNEKGATLLSDLLSGYCR